MQPSIFMHHMYTFLLFSYNTIVIYVATYTAIHIATYIRVHPIKYLNMHTHLHTYAIVALYQT